MVFLYAGQGAQKPGMGKDFYEGSERFRKFLDEMEDALSADEPGLSLKKLMFEASEEELAKTANTQPCMGAFQAGVTMLLKEKGICPEAACGLSLGEYGALYAAGVFSAEDYLKLLRFRGKAMEEAAEGIAFAMSAVLGTENALIEEVVGSYAGAGKVYCANYNCPGQTVICGDEEAVAWAEAELKARGSRRCTRLKVGGPFHTAYMDPAAEALEGYMETMTFASPGIPVISNVKGDYYAPEDSVKALLVSQVKSSVRLEQGLRALLADGHRDFLEIGPGNTMSGFVKKTAKAMGLEIQVRSIEHYGDI